MNETDLIEKLKQSIINCDEEEAKKVAEEIVAAGIDPVKAVNEGISPAAKVVGEKFEKGEYFLTHLMLAGEAMKAASEILMSKLSEKEKERVSAEKGGSVVLATVSGDIHDIGKNILVYYCQLTALKSTTSAKTLTL